MNKSLALRTRHLRGLLFEGLETRYALSGMVSAAIDGGDLLIQGDSSSNQVLISAGPLPGQVIVSGGQQTTDVLTATQINGGTAPVTLTGFTGNLIVNLKGGDDQLLLTNISLPGMANVSLGSGDDSFDLQSVASSSVIFTPNNSLPLNYGPVQAGQSVFVDAGAGDDTVRFVDATVIDDLLVYGGDGNDAFVQSGTTVSQNLIGGILLLNMAAGDDSVNMSRLNVGGAIITDPIANTSTTVNLTNVHAVGDITMYLSINIDNVNIHGEDNTNANAVTADNLVVHTGNGDDRITINNANVNSLRIYSGEGNEGGSSFGVQLTNLKVRDDLTLDTAGGTDNALLQAITAGSIHVNTGDASDGLVVRNTTATDAVFAAGDSGDVLGFYDSQFKNLSELLALGDDTLYLSNITATASTMLDGGDGNDVLNDLGGLNLTNLTRLSI